MHDAQIKAHTACELHAALSTAALVMARPLHACAAFCEIKRDPCDSFCGLSFAAAPLTAKAAQP